MQHISLQTHVSEKKQVRQTINGHRILTYCKNLLIIKFILALICPTYPLLPEKEKEFH